LRLLSFGDKTLKETHYHVSLFFDADIVDLTYKDASIQTIYRLLVKFLCEAYNPRDEYVALIQIPTTKRLELRHDTNQDIDFFDNNYFVYYPRSKDFPKLQYAKLKKFNAPIFEQKMINDRHTYFIYAISNLLEIYNIEYIMFNADEPLHEDIPVTKKYYAPYAYNKTANYVLDQEKTELYYSQKLTRFYRDHCS